MHTSQRPKQLELIPVSLVWSMPRSILLLPLGWDASPSKGHPPAVCCRYPFIHRVKRDKVEHSLLSKETTRWVKLELQTSRSGVWGVELLATQASFMMRLSVKTCTASNVTNNPTQNYFCIWPWNLSTLHRPVANNHYVHPGWKILLCLLTAVLFLTDLCNSSKLCSSNAWWPMAPNVCSWATRKFGFFS